MKPLNRPMFRYGGPIKEGIMDGIREPKKNGGPTGTGLVGDQRYPKTNGREHHALFIPPALAIGAGLTALRTGAMRMAPRAIQGIRNFFTTPVTKTVQKQGPTLTLPGKTTYSKGYSGTVPGKKITPGTGEVTTSQLKPYFANDPIIATGGKIIQGLTSPTSKGIIQKGARLVLSPTGVATGLIYAGGKFFDQDGNEKPPPPNVNELKLGDRVGTSGAPGGGDPGMFLTPRVKDPGSGVELTPEELRKQRVERYRDIMDIKGMNKKAAYDSLIEASRLINESGDFKGDVKSGRLINQIIQGASKAFDKPSKTKDAIDTLILKGEIEKDIKASDPAAKLAAELTGKKIALADKQLKGDTLEETVNAIYAKTGAFPSGSGLAGVARTKGIDVKMVIKSEDINNYLEANPGKDAVDFMESQVLEATKAGTPVEPGAYVVKDRIIVIDSEGNVSPYL
jgi:hypothetical protein